VGIGGHVDTVVEITIQKVRSNESVTVCTFRDTVFEISLDPVHPSEIVVPTGIKEDERIPVLCHYVDSSPVS
jgi:hypothetical protein